MGKAMSGVTDGGVKTTPQKTRFRSVNSTRNLRTGQKLSKWLQ